MTATTAATTVVLDALGYETTYTYDDRGRLRTQTDALGNHGRAEGRAESRGVAHRANQEPAGPLAHHGAPGRRLDAVHILQIIAERFRLFQR